MTMTLTAGEIDIVELLAEGFIRCDDNVLSGQRLGLDVPLVTHSCVHLKSQVWNAVYT